MNNMILTLFVAVLEYMEGTVKYISTSIANYTPNGLVWEGAFFEDSVGTPLTNYQVVKTIVDDPATYTALGTDGKLAAIAIYENLPQRTFIGLSSSHVALKAAA